MYNFVVPQELNIADRIGKFTFAQLGFISFGFLTIMILFMTDSIPMWLSLMIGLPVLIFSLILGFFKRYDMPMYQYLIISIQYNSLPKEMIYSSIETFEDDDEG